LPSNGFPNVNFMSATMTTSREYLAGSASLAPSIRSRSLEHLQLAPGNPRTARHGIPGAIGLRIGHGGHVEPVGLCGEAAEIRSSRAPRRIARLIRTRKRSGVHWPRAEQLPGKGRR
jgi:hypothetical protein